MAPGDFRYAFLNTVPPVRQLEIFDQYVVPETGRVFFQAAFSAVSPGSPARVNFQNRVRAPLLLIAGGSDHIVPPQINRSNFRAYRSLGARTAYKEFPGRCHWIIAQDGWQEVAGYICDWLASFEWGRETLTKRFKQREVPEAAAGGRFVPPAAPHFLRARPRAKVIWFFAREGAWRVLRANDPGTSSQASRRRRPIPVG